MRKNDPFACLQDQARFPAFARYFCVRRGTRRARHKNAFVTVVAMSLLGFTPLHSLAKPNTEAAQIGEQALLDEVALLDRRLANVMYRLVLANANNCKTTMPLTGMLLHAKSQYSASIAERMARLGKFPESVAVAFVVKGSPADIAGVKAGDGIVSINGAPVESPTTSQGTGSDERDSVERRIANLSINTPLQLSLRRFGQNGTLAVVITPLPACRTRWEVTYDRNVLAQSDGDIIQMSADFISTNNDDAIAVIAAHELAHTALDHRRILEEQGASYGLLSVFGRSGRLIRRAEEEADLYSLQLLRTAKFDPMLAVAFWSGPGRRYAGGILRSPTHASARSRAGAMAREIARLTCKEQSSSIGLQPLEANLPSDLKAPLPGLSRSPDC